MQENPSARAIRTDPEKFKVGKASAARLAALTGIDAGKLAGKTIGQLAKAFPFEIDPRFFFMRRVCGTVVKTDPVSGIDYPVPFATVQVEDTDCSLLGYFPVNSPWSWFFPFLCKREVIATVKTDECGKFCVWIPRFEIDWVLRWRRIRKCFPIIFERPNLIDIIDHLIPERIPPFPPIPGPDPSPLDGPDRDLLVTRITQAFGQDVGVKLARLSTPAGFGTSTEERDAEGLAPALLDHIAPPLPPEIRLQLGEVPGKGDHPAVTTIAHGLALDPKALRGIDLRHYIGPFKRCIDIHVPVWAPILDVPDITFRVLQDTNGDGIEEQIYGEGHFQVRWNSGSLSNLVLHAGPNAIAAPLCGPELIPCGNVPEIVMAGRLPLVGAPAVFNPTTGYALRTNRPHPSGRFDDPLPVTQAASPLHGLLSLYGCAKTNPAATHYRIVYEYSSNGGASFAPATPFLGYTWPLYRLNGGIGEWHYATPDSKGWYPLALPAGPAWLPQDLLLDWPSTSKPDGVYRMVLQLGLGGSDTAMSQSGNVSVVVDNSKPLGAFSVGYSASPTGPFAPLDSICPVVKRGVTPQDMYFSVSLAVSAAHLRSAEMWASGCGAGEFSFESGSGGQHPLGSGANPSGLVPFQHWHNSTSDNSQVLQVLYKLPASAQQGTYSFGSLIVSRAFNPLDGGHLQPSPWEFSPVEKYIQPPVYFSVFNANP